MLPKQFGNISKIYYQDNFKQIYHLPKRWYVQDVWTNGHNTQFRILCNRTPAKEDKCSKTSKP